MTLEGHLVESASGEYSRKLWLLPGAQAQPQTLCIFLDAEYYLERMETLSILSDLQTHDLFATVTWVFVSHGGQPASGMLQEVGQLVAVERIVRELKTVGDAVHYHRFAGGHQTVPWQAELPKALRWLLAFGAARL